MKKIWYWLTLIWHIGKRKKIHRQYVRSIRKSVFNSIAYAYTHGKDNVAFREKEKFDMAMDILSSLNLFGLWRHDGVFYIIYLKQKENEEAVHSPCAPAGPDGTGVEQSGNLGRGI